MSNDKEEIWIWGAGRNFALAILGTLLLLGAATVYLVRKSAAPPMPGSDPKLETNVVHRPFSPQEMRHVADQAARPLLAELAKRPRDADKLARIGNVYCDARVYETCIDYYTRALEINPANSDVRTDLGNACYYTGDPDRAIAEFQRALDYHPRHAHALFNLGIVEWTEKRDAEAAVNAWRRLLQTNPDEPTRRYVQSLMAQALAGSNSWGSQPHGKSSADRTGGKTPNKP